MKIYKEKNFLKNRDAEAYKKKQAESCCYLINLFGKIEYEPWKTLLVVHRRQYREIGYAVSNPNKSFYFDSMYKEVKESSKEEYRLAIHCVSYERGIERYKQLMSYSPDKIWSVLYNDAVANHDLCLSYLMSNYRSWKKIWKSVIKIEKEIMKQIDKNKE
jgi:hypothetical protein